MNNMKTYRSLSEEYLQTFAGSLHSDSTEPPKIHEKMRKETGKIIHFFDALTLEDRASNELL